MTLNIATITDNAIIQAKKTFQSVKNKTGFLVITVSYDKNLVLPYQDGLAYMAAIANAETFTGDYNNKQITSIQKDQITATFLSYADYECHKIAAILNVTYDDLKKYNPNAQTELPF